MLLAPFHGDPPLSQIKKIHAKYLVWLIRDNGKQASVVFTNHESGKTEQHHWSWSTSSQGSEASCKFSKMQHLKESNVLVEPTGLFDHTTDDQTENLLSLSQKDTNGKMQEAI
jgi:hypothetical protein